MRVLFAATEAAPWVKVGGLGDVVGSLPRALRENDVDACIALPAHAGVLDRAPDPKHVLSFDVPHSDGPLRAQIYESKLDGVPVFLVRGAPIDRDGLVYTGRMDEEGHRFTFFSLAVAELCRQSGFGIDILHAHDWHTAVAAARAPVPSILTVHNLPYSGDGAQSALHRFSVGPVDEPRIAPALRHVPLAIGLSLANAVTTVSMGYAREMQTPEYGCGFETLLAQRGVTGIVNGLDTALWDPSTDGELPTWFDRVDREPREICRAALVGELELVDDGRPMVAFIGRLVGQKGVDLALGALERLRELPWNAVFLGTGEPELEAAVTDFAKRFPERVHARIGFDARLSRRIFGGADMLLIPSRYEPCGMTQMIAMRYGCVPVATETGGLADTVRDPELTERPTGFLCGDATHKSVAFGLRRALALHARPSRWSTLIENGMARDFGWGESAARYRALYGVLAAGRSI